MLSTLPFTSSTPQYPDPPVNRRDLVRELGVKISLRLGCSDVAAICADYLVPPTIFLVIHGLRSNTLGGRATGNYDNWMTMASQNNLCAATFMVSHDMRFGAVREIVNLRFIISQGWEVNVELGSEGSLTLEDSATVAEVMRDHQMSPELAYFRTTLVNVQEKFRDMKNVELASDCKTVQLQKISTFRTQ